VKGGTLNAIFTGALAIEGGELLIVDGKIAGAIGVSGGSGAQDGLVARVGVGGAEVGSLAIGDMPMGMSPAETAWLQASNSRANIATYSSCFAPRARPAGRSRR
jgi:hypothetical protein